MFKRLKEDIAVVMEKDPAARGAFEVLCTYSGVRALWRHRRAQWFYRHNMRFIARIISQRTKRFTGIEIHPAASLGRRLFIDHGSGIVIGETAEIGEDVVLYQGVTLGGTGKDTGKRHPTLANHVMISSGAKVLGPITIGEGSKIGAGSVVLKDVPPHCTVVGVPGRVVKQHDKRIADMDQIKLPDPILEEFARLNKRIITLEDKLGVRACKYSLSNDLENNPELENEDK